MSDNQNVDAVLLRAIAEIIGFVNEEHWTEFNARGLEIVLSVVPDRFLGGEASEGKRVVQKIFSALGKECLTGEELARRTKYSKKGGYFNEALSELVRQGRLVNDGDGYHLP